jgi:transposase InsO family protein
MLAKQEGANVRELCRRYGISHETAYKWLGRAVEGDADWASDRSRRPHHSPNRTPESLERAVLDWRDAHPAWGARKILRCLERDGIDPPAASTVHAILARHGRIVPPPGGDRATGRFEYPAPNLVWQMDFKGDVPLTDGVRCHPLTALDDHSRFALCLQACANQQATTVKGRLTLTFQRYGIPDAFLLDNGSPWGGGPGYRWTEFSVWLLKLGIKVIHSRPFHPQTRGKNERFHRTLIDEVVNLRPLANLTVAQDAFDDWRTVYNFERPHQGIGMETPASRYAPSHRAMPDKPISPEYDSGEITRRVGTTKSYISFMGRLWKMPHAFRSELLAIRPRQPDGTFAVCFGANQIATLNLHDDENPT